MPACDRAGHFLAEIIEYGLQQATDAQSKSVGVTFRVLLTQMWDGEKWIDWRQYEMDAYGTSWIVKKDGTVNDRAVEDLCKHCGWDGALSSIAEFTWKATPCRVEVKEDTYKGETRYRVEWINSFDSIPGGGMGNVDSDKLKELETRFGPALRAVTANVRRNQPAPNGSRPSAPPKPPAAPAMAGGDGIRF
jgi:hypothetical protein